MRYLFLSFWLVCANVLPAAAQHRDAVETAFQGWLDEVGARGVLTVWRGGAQQMQIAAGLDPSAPVELASLSKAITGVCALSLIDEGRWTPQTTAADILGPSAGSAVTVAALLTHRSGLGPDATQGVLVALLPLARARAPGVGAAALARGVGAERAADFYYNNENYAVLGDMIAVETGQSYEAACRARALSPAGVHSAVPSARTGPMLAWGGWTMTVDDYAAFHHHWFGPEGRVGNAPETWPRHSFDGAGYFYGPGMFQRPMRAAHNFWHFGSQCFPGQLNAGAFTVSWFSDWSAVAAYDVCLTWPQMVALDHTLAAAILGPNP